MLRLDVGSYALAEMNKEKSVARFLGWLNVALGTLLLIVYWAF
ncbi:CLC_0170 family protein [Brevibacillus ruminantium]